MILKEQEKFVRKFNKLLKSSEKNIISISIDKDQYTIKFINGQIFKFKFYLPIDMIPFIPIHKTYKKLLF